MKFHKPKTKAREYVFKPYIFPDGFVIVVDTREQTRLFSRTKGLISTVSTLQNGDYSIQGFENTFAIERKGIGDFYSYIGKERDKTINKLERLSQYEFAALVIEASEGDVFTQQFFTKVSPGVARGFLTSINIRYGIHSYINRDRVQLERWILDRAIKYYNLKRSGEYNGKGQ